MGIDTVLTAIATLVGLLALIAGGWRFLYNHIEHVRAEIRAARLEVLGEVTEVRKDIRELREYLFKRRVNE